MAFTPSPERKKTIDEILTRYPTKRAACIPVLHVCQAEHGWVSAEIVAYVSGLLEIATSEVQGVVTFYTMFQQQPVAKHVVWVCRTLSCDLMGGKAIQEHLEKRLGCHVGETSSNGQFSLKKAECLAGCGYAPMVQIDDRFYEGLTPAKLDQLLDAVERGAPAAQQETPWYQGAAPAAGATTPSAAPSSPKASVTPAATPSATATTPSATATTLSATAGTPSTARAATPPVKASVAPSPIGASPSPAATPPSAASGSVPVPASAAAGRAASVPAPAASPAAEPPAPAAPSGAPPDGSSSSGSPPE